MLSTCWTVKVTSGAAIHLVSEQAVASWRKVFSTGPVMVLDRIYDIHRIYYPLIALTYVSITY